MKTPGLCCARLRVWTPALLHGCQYCRGSLGAGSRQTSVAREGRSWVDCAAAAIIVMEGRSCCCCCCCTFLWYRAADLVQDMYCMELLGQALCSSSTAGMYGDEPTDVRTEGLHESASKCCRCQTAPTLHTPYACFAPWLVGVVSVSVEEEQGRTEAMECLRASNRTSTIPRLAAPPTPSTHRTTIVK